METLFDIPIMFFADRTAWERWLRDNYTLQSGVWIKIAKKDSGIASVTHLEALDNALCYGWIDGQRRSLDAQYFLQKFTPRRPRSIWSKVNIGKVEALTKAGRMRAPGLQAIADAQADGRWALAYDSQKKAKIPPDLQAVLDKDKHAKAAYESLTKAGQYSLLFKLMTAKTPQIRAARLQLTIDKLTSSK